jgi:hypothetical protein
LFVFFSFSSSLTVWHLSSLNILCLFLNCRACFWVFPLLSLLPNIH